ncbi:MAG TPA: sigma-54 dependent transcriptional regulator [Thermoanaerobaculia bacterium]|jgi:DNA-binding NtrC family response regulator|nr:sigma-54 dependent transcriptional regulator [Thermoanaerobaculia bacterium]
MTVPLKILVVDDEEAMREVLRERLESFGFEVSTAADGAAAERRVAAFDPDAVLTDVVLPDTSGLDLLRIIRGAGRDRPVILITAHGTVELAVEAMKGGATDFLTKPVDYERLRALFDGMASTLQSSRRAAEAEGLGELVGTSKAMRDLFKMIREVASTDVPVLISGESGTGKEVAANTIHSLSRRAAAPFHAINCAAIPAELMESEIFGHEKGSFTGAIGQRKGCFEMAHGGTLFLDEIAEMPMALQPKLLRVLEDGKVRRIGGRGEIQVDVRHLAATNKDPEDAIKKGQLREDLYYRLNVLRLHLPPLRERAEDIALLATRFVDHGNRRHGTEVEGLSNESRQALESYPWPGNVRELRNVIERGLVLAKTGRIGKEHLPLFLREPGASAKETIAVPLGTTVADAERELILKTLEQTGNNKAEAARWLGVDVKTIRNKLKSYGLT